MRKIYLLLFALFLSAPVTQCFARRIRARVLSVAVCVQGNATTEQQKLVETNLLKYAGERNYHLDGKYFSFVPQASTLYAGLDFSALSDEEANLQIREISVPKRAKNVTNFVVLGQVNSSSDALHILVKAYDGESGFLIGLAQRSSVTTETIADATMQIGKEIVTQMKLSMRDYKGGEPINSLHGLYDPAISKGYSKLSSEATEALAAYREVGYPYYIVTDVRIIEQEKKPVYRTRTETYTDSKGNKQTRTVQELKGYDGYEIKQVSATRYESPTQKEYVKQNLRFEYRQRMEAKFVESSDKYVPAGYIYTFRYDLFKRGKREVKLTHPLYMYPIGSGGDRFKKPDALDYSPYSNIVPTDPTVYDLMKLSPIGRQKYGIFESYESFKNHQIVKEERFEVNGVPFTMVLVQGAIYDYSGVKILLSDYFISKTEVTQELWEAVMGRNRSAFSGKRLPVESISASECETFVQKLSALTGRNFRIPTRQELIYASYGGVLSRGYTLPGSNTEEKILTTNISSTVAVGKKQPTELGIYDLHGNVMEYCQNSNTMDEVPLVTSEYNIFADNLLLIDPLHIEISGVNLMRVTDEIEPVGKAYTKDAEAEKSSNGLRIVVEPEHTSPYYYW